MKAWAIHQLKMAMLEDLKLCHTDFERANVRAIYGKEIRQKTIDWAKQRKLTPGGNCNSIRIRVPSEGATEMTEAEQQIREMADEHQPVSEPTEPYRQAILGAVARAWCHPLHSHKEMDASLAETITNEVLAINRSEPRTA